MSGSKKTESKVFHQIVIIIKGYTFQLSSISCINYVRHQFVLPVVILKVDSCMSEVRREYTKELYSHRISMSFHCHGCIVHSAIILTSPAVCMLYHLVYL